jgi:hypothetical protein
LRKDINYHIIRRFLLANILLVDNPLRVTEVNMQFNVKNMPFRRLGSSGLRVPVFSIGGWLTIGGTVKGDPVKVRLYRGFSGEMCW